MTNILKYTANYSYTNHNFVIQNLNNSKHIDNDMFATFCVLKNILQRGSPTLMSNFLQKNLCKIHKMENFKKLKPLISNKQPQWLKSIKGYEKKNDYPAMTFFNEIIPENFGNLKFIQNLILPEASINEITNKYNEKYQNQTVDFFLPQANLVIEIDGSQHSCKGQEIKDIERDQYLFANNINVVRIPAVLIKKNSDELSDKIKEIKNIIMENFDNANNNSNIPFRYSLKSYQEAYNKKYNLNLPDYVVTSIMRFQILLLELLSCGKLEIKQTWKFELFCNDEKDYSTELKLAIDDLILWLKNLLNLQNYYLPTIHYDIKTVNKTKEFSYEKNSIQIDFSLLKRYTDENSAHNKIIYVRNDYFDSNNNFNISTTNLISYEINTNSSKQINSLWFFAYNLFLQDKNMLSENVESFRDGQVDIICNALNKRHTIGLLPTGSGKSLCYQLSAILQPTISFVVSPIKALMYDQEAELNSNAITVVKALTGDLNAKDKERIQLNYANGKYWLLLISPERFQTISFRNYLRNLNTKYKIGYAIIDEVHCLSEWGHDFRTSYLNLVDTINTYCPSSIYLGLTATASLNVLKDLQKEFQIDKSNIKTIAIYKRDDISFEIKDVKLIPNPSKNKNINEKNKHKKLDVLYQIINPNKKGCIFTPYRNNPYWGCYGVCQHLQESQISDIRGNISFYCGEKPNDFPGTQQEFEEFKHNVQIQFKNGDINVLVATKAFGMGVNINDIDYTVHYGIPSSIESLYQEAGRAGRDLKYIKEKAQCYVLLGQDSNEEVLDRLFNFNTPPELIHDLIAQLDQNSDVSKQMFLIASKFHSFINDIDFLNALIQSINDDNTITATIVYQKYKQFNKRISWAEFIQKYDIEKGIYRLKQLGIIIDWTKDFMSTGVSSYTIVLKEFSPQTIEKNLQQVLSKYDHQFDINTIYKTDIKTLELNLNDNSLDKYFYIISRWSYEYFAYNRRQALKDVYEKCKKVVNKEISNDTFKLSIERYFSHSSNTDILESIVENYKDYNNWINPFKVKQDFIQTDEIKDVDGIQELQDNLSRYLETYQNNAGLNFISGLTRFLLNDYDNTDGRERFEKSLGELKNENDKTICEFIDNLSLIIQKNQNKDAISKSIIDIIKPSKKVLFHINDTFKDDYSAYIIIDEMHKKLQEIKKRVGV